MQSAEVPQGVRVSVGFFALSGALELAIALWDAPTPVQFWPLWEALGRALLPFLIAAGLWRRSSLCRAVASVYCAAVLITYAIVLAMAYAHAPVSFPSAVVFKSFYEIPSCALLLPWLRSERAASVFTRPLIEG